MYDKENKICYCDKIQIIEINMDKIMHMWYHGDKKKALEYKYFLMLDLKPSDLGKISKGDRIMEKYEENIKKLNEDPTFIEVVSKEKDAEMTYNTFREEGFAEGISSRNIEIAKNMLSKGLDINTISECTDLTLEQIKELKK